MKNINRVIERFLWRCLPRRLYLFLWAFYASFINCHTLICRMGFFRSALTGGSVDGHGQPQPWLTYPAIAFLNELDLSNIDVFEFGSGYSTAYFSRRVRSVLSVEHESEWRDKALAMCNGRKNVEIIVADNEQDYLAAINLRTSYDLIVVDGEWRLACAKAAVGKLRPGGMIIVDDAEISNVGKEAAEYLKASGLLRVDFWGFAPYVHYSKATDVFFDKHYNASNCATPKCHLS